MNNVVANYHTHTYLCKHAIGKPIDYVRRAVELGYEEIAITDHGPLIDEIINSFYTRRMSYDQYYKNYLPELSEAIEKYSSQIKIIKGIEIEYFESMKDEYKNFLKDLDMLIIGQHYFYYNNQYSNVYNRLTDDEIKKYGQTVIQAMETGMFKIIAHPEIFAYTRKWDDICEEVSEQIIKSAKKNNVYIELNANGIRNCIERKKYWIEDGETNYSYPRREFFKIVKKYNMPIIINDDAHDPKMLNDEFTDLAYKMADELGLTILKKIN